MGIGMRTLNYKNWTNNGVENGGATVKSGKNTHLLVRMCARISQKFGLTNDKSGLIKNEIAY